jgi:catechol 2,3-dioxygenase-like lactoylglutathione lyase family enzyme
MFDHVKFGVSDYALSKAFYAKALAPLGVAVGGEGEPSYGVELVAQGKLASLCLFQTAEKPAHLHVAFAADTRQQVDAFYRAALEAPQLLRGLHHRPGRPQHRGGLPPGQCLKLPATKRPAAAFLHRSRPRS